MTSSKSKSKLPPSGVEVFDVDASQEAKVVGGLRLAAVSPGGDTEEALLHEQAATAQRVSPIGGASACEETRELLDEVRELVDPKEAPLDLLESRYDSLLLLLRELYDRLDGGLSVEDLTYFEDRKARTLGFIDYSSEEHLYVHVMSLKGATSAIAEFLGIDRSKYMELMRTPEGRQWLFEGNDPSDWPPELQSEEVEGLAELAELWDTPEVVDEASLPEATCFGERDRNGAWHEN